MAYPELISCTETCKLGLMFSLTSPNRPNSLIDTIASNNGYRQNNTLFKLTYQLSYSKSRDAIASKISHRITITLLKIMSIKSHVGATELQLPY